MRASTVTRLGVSFICAAMLFAAACGANGGEASKSPDAKPSTAQGLTPKQAEIMYGGGVKPDPSVTFQPDVVVVEGGPQIVRSVSEDGFVWTIDAHAKGAADVKPGKVMFATAKALGRVETADRKGDDLVVKLAPVDIPAVFKDAKLSIDQPLTADDFAGQYMPGVPDAYEHTEAEDEAPEATVTPSGAFETFDAGPRVVPAAAEIPTVVLPAVKTNSGTWPPVPTSPETGRHSLKFTMGQWEIEPVLRGTAAPEGNAGEFTINALYKKHSKFRVGLTASVRYTNLRVRSNLNISNGVVGQSSFVMEGINGIAVKMFSGTATANGTMKMKLEIPFDHSFPMVVSGVPMMGVVKWKLLFELGLVGRNSNMTASTLYLATGPIGIIGTSLKVPVLKEIKPMIDNLNGLPVGPSGAVYGFEFKGGIALGIPAAYTGPYGKVTVVFGNTMGGLMDTLTGDCKQAVAYVDVAGGWGLQVSASKHKVIEKILGRDVDLTVVEISKRVVDKQDWLPKIVKCRVV